VEIRRGRGRTWCLRRSRTSGASIPRGSAAATRGQTDAYATASVLYPPSFAIAATGFGDTLTLSSGFCESGLASEEVEAIFARMAELLAGA